MATFDNMVDGRYRLEVELGRGGFGAVYRAKQLVMGRELRDVALKLFHEGAITPDNVLEKMNDAISLIRVLGEVDDITIRQHFIDVYDLGVTCDDEPQAFIAMELVRGGDLRQRTRDRGKLNVKATMHYLLQITRAIGFMHSQPEPMLHRDLKPDNLLLARRGGPDVVKIADFGLAQALDDAISLGTAGGTLAYMAPEGFEYATAVTASDVYSIGLIGYEMLFNENPFSYIGRNVASDDAAGREQAREMHINSRRHGVKIRPKLALDLAAHPEFIEVLERALAHDVGKRYRTAQQFYEDLKRIWAGDFPAEVAPAEESPEEGLLRCRREVDYHLRHERFADALEAAESMAAEFPTSPASYMAVAAVAMAQADHMETAGRMAFRDRFLAQAATVLRQNMERCPRGDRGDLMRMLARVYQRLGDGRTAATWLGRASQNGGGER